MKVLILGGTGFIGQHLAELCLKHNDDVVIAGRHEPDSNDFPFQKLDLLDLDSLIHGLKTHKPEQIYHLAGFTSSAESRKQPLRCYKTNVLGTQNLLSAIKQQSPEARLLITGSAAEYGRATCNPITEQSPLNPVSPYGVSRAAVSLMAQQQQFQTPPIQTVVVRLFNIFGPRQSHRFICAEFARAFAQAVKRKASSLTLQTGNLTLKRDFSSVFQAAKGLRAAMQHADTFQIYNLCSGVPRPLLDIVQGLEQITGIQAEVQTLNSKLRPGDPECLVGSPEKLRHATGFQVDNMDFLPTLGKTYAFQLETLTS